MTNGQKHELRCPACGADFAAYGEPPLVIECPACHKQGYLPPVPGADA